MALSATIFLDSSGFPMIEIPGMNLAMSWLPITKIQFEHFLCDTNMFNDVWYQDLLNNFTPRVSPTAIRLGDYWNLFLTGILPSEAVRFANWMGRDYRLPTVQEWNKALLTFAEYSALPEHIDKVLSAVDDTTKPERTLNERAALICRNLEEITPSDANQLVSTEGRRLCDQMLMRLGLVEYVYEDNQMNTFAGWGQPNKRFFGSTMNPIARNAKPVQLVNRAEGTRMKHFGFRLVRRLR